MSGIQTQVEAIAEAGQTTLVLHGGEPAATRMLPSLPEVCFAESPEVIDAVLFAAAYGLDQVILFTTAEGLPSADVRLGDITTAMGGTPELAADVAKAGKVPQACVMWREADILGPCARELCRRVADDLENTAGGSLAAQVVLLDDDGERMLAMYGRLQR